MINQSQKQMIADLLLRTNNKTDIKINSEKILGNTYGNKETVKVYTELAKSKLQMIKSRTAK